jgi:2-polyprenyl-3-methyl-5-hydroxy-6-metoxy-1,4-benzoquinol methylase
MNNLFRNFPSIFRNFITDYLVYRTPVSISRNFRIIDQSGLNIIADSLRRNYFSQGQNFLGDSVEQYLDSPKGKQDYLDHLFQRLDGKRKSIIPWLNSNKPLKDLKILEIGCGTGSITVALAEQGANVTAIDVNESSILVAKDRCRIYGLEAEFVIANASDVYKTFENRAFELIIFYASLEHMTLEERLLALSAAWGMLSKGGLLCIAETPNRLWYFDIHTSLLPFYFWLPDDLAFQYSKYSPRNGFNTFFISSQKNELWNDFFRWGRGVSFHEFDLAIGKSEELRIISCFTSFLISRSFLFRIKHKLSDDYHFETFLRKQAPQIHCGFFHPWLNLIIEKDL